jgi:hypothetical protein
MAGTEGQRVGSARINTGTGGRCTPHGPPSRGEGPRIIASRFGLCCLADAGRERRPRRSQRERGRIPAVAKKRPASSPQPEQLVFPFELRVGDVIEEDGERLEVVGRPTGAVWRQDDLRMGP